MNLQRKGDSPMGTEPVYDDVAESYDRWAPAADSILSDPVFADLVGAVDRQTVCAVACGAGREARFLATCGASVTGVDISAKLLDIARRREAERPQEITYLSSDAHNLDALADQSFDGVVCYMALMDIPRLDLALAAIARILRPGGWFVFAITHPCFKAPATGEIIDHVDGSVRRTVGRYFIEGYWDGPGKHVDHLPTGAYHRTLSTYVNTLSESGFIIERMSEPPLDTPVWREVPCLLYVRCRLAQPMPVANGTT
jgi:ubiquinone/menaquinone biosynthesis C-methylase UbiE